MSEKQKQPETITIKRTYENLHKIGPVKFMPGINIVSQENYESILANPGWKKGFQDQLSEGKLILIKGETEDGKETQEVGKMNVRDARKYIGELYDVKQLNALKESEIDGPNRGGVLVAIDAQIKEMEKPIKKKKDGDE